MSAESRFREAFARLKDKPVRGCICRYTYKLDESGSQTKRLTISTCPVHGIGGYASAEGRVSP